MGSDTFKITTSLMIRIVPMDYPKVAAEGEYGLDMVSQSDFEGGLFIFDDNVEDHNTARSGEGTALTRPYNRYGKYKNYPRSAGIPKSFSRTDGSFTKLTPEIKRIIDSSFTEIRKILKENKYDEICFAADVWNEKESRPLMQTCFFSLGVGEDVEKYVSDQIYELGFYDGDFEQ